MFWSYRVALAAALLAPLGAGAGPRVDAVSAAPVTVVGEEELINEVSIADVLGTIVTLQTPNTARPHVLVEGSVSTSDYFRGRYDGDPEDLDQINASGSVTAVLELIRERDGLVKTVNFIAGFRNSIGERPDEVFTDALWYESDHYASIVGRLPYDLVGAFTYTVFDNPTGELNNSEELMLSFEYTGDNAFGGLSPQIKFATRTRGFPTDGIYVEGSISPAFRLSDENPLILTVPIIAGVGFDNYYATEASKPAWGSVGLYGVYPLDLSREWGNWSLWGGADVMIRETALEEQDPFFSDADNVVLSGSLGVRFFY